jgi:hypothetical protein
MFQVNSSSCYKTCPANGRRTTTTPRDCIGSPAGEPQNYVTLYSFLAETLVMEYELPEICSFCTPLYSSPLHNDEGLLHCQCHECRFFFYHQLHCAGQRTLKSIWLEFWKHKWKIYRQVWSKTGFYVLSKKEKWHIRILYNSHRTNNNILHLNIKRNAQEKNRKMKGMSMISNE